ncbi:MAG: CCA tRNA nucleotidyltransferase [Chitinispirillaceae bacterium]|jgi:poly(A) polymerase
MNGANFQEKRQAAEEVVSRLVKNGFSAFFAGGYVRDKLLGNAESADIDIATNAMPQSVMELFSHTIAVGVRFGVVIVVHHDIPFEVATFRSDIGIGDGRHPDRIVYTDARDDALRRDFTINGVFYDPIGDRVIDFVAGEEDLRAKVVRAIGDPVRRFKEDYLRLLRAIRFAARLGFSIDEVTWKAMVANATGIGGVSAERIFVELDRMLRQPHADRAFMLLRDSGLLHETLPEVADLVEVEQPAEFHPEGDVFSHTVKALGLLSRGDNPEPVSAVLGWSVLLHDVGKKATMQRLDRIRFNNHHQVGADLARAILKRMRVSNDLLEAVAACIENHMNFMNVMEMRLSTIKKLLSRPTINDELELHRIDCLASHGNLDNYHFIKNRLAAFTLERIRPAPLLRGADLLALGFEAGPIFGTILREVYDLQLDEKLPSRVDAIKYVKEHWGDGGEKNGDGRMRNEG